MVVYGNNKKQIVDRIVKLIGIIVGVCDKSDLWKSESKAALVVVCNVSIFDIEYDD